LQPSQAVAREVVEAETDHGAEEYDVYVHDAQPLAAGEEKHMLSVFVADEKGLINRVAGVFARRGANIESLAVGLNIDKALFTISVTGNKAAVANLVKQLAKLVKVRYVEDITATSRVERELALIKVRAPAGPARTEVIQLCDMFRARIMDVSEHNLTLAVTGDAGKVLAMQLKLAKFGIVELARTGKISLKRGRQLLEMGGWGDSATKRAQRLRQRAADMAGSAEHADRASSEHEGDVYIIDDEGPGVWDVEHVLDASYDNSSLSEAHTLSIEVDDRPGCLNEVTGVFARRGFNVQSLAVGPSETEGRSRITMVVPGGSDGLQNLIKQVYKVIFVMKVTDMTDVPHIARELMMIKLRCNASQRREVRDLVDIFKGNVCDVSLDTITVEVLGKEDKMAAIQSLLRPYGILEIARTGRVALTRDSGVDTRNLAKQHLGRVTKAVHVA